MWKKVVTEAETEIEQVQGGSLIIDGIVPRLF